MVTIRVDADRFKTGAFRALDAFSVHMGDAREPFHRIALDFYRQEEENFARGGVPQKFPPISPKYEEWKAKHFPGQPVLRLRDNLYNALTGRQPDDTNKARPIREITPRTLRIGVESPYVRHQANAGRKALQVTNATRARWRAIMHEWARKTLAEELKR